MKTHLRRGERWQASRLENAGFAFCGDPCSEPEAPDYSGIASANEKSAALSKEAADNQLAFSKEQYAFLLPYVQKQLETGQDVAAQQKADSAKASERADQPAHPALPRPRRPARACSWSGRRRRPAPACRSCSSAWGSSGRRS